MTKVLLMADNHNRLDLVQQILKTHQGLDYYIHCGDSYLSATELKAMFDVAVAGNNDRNTLPKYEIISLETWKILVCHGHLFFSNALNPIPELQIALKKHGCNAVFYGHTHIASDLTVNHQRYLCPGSLTNPRSEIGPSFMLLSITPQEIKAELIKV